VCKNPKLLKNSMKNNPARLGGEYL
jgi:hypothetical protein